ncbi:MAG: hypothetical protein Terrestrivirus2_110 [Terrestrivirus sp.]|uniref:Uncharacterized protein n=1 Tax=Terrestrivirus sp. TaxID=2487775 RepID=A0A3G4ZL74_9VIRU|nr:MAG: hypothetical protein Terrestrivirus2_110 [Terrestrivirus sp.]
MGLREALAGCCACLGACLGGCGLIIFLLAFVFSELGFAISGSVILAQNNGIMHGPWNVWIYVLVQVLLLYISFFGLANDQRTKTETDSNGKKNTVTVSKSSGFINLAMFGISIWGLVIYNQMDSVNREMYQTLYPSLLLYLQAVTTYFLILYIIAAVIAVLACCGICLGSCAGSSDSRSNFSFP